MISNRHIILASMIIFNLLMVATLASSQNSDFQQSSEVSTIDTSKTSSFSHYYSADTTSTIEPNWTHSTIGPEYIRPIAISYDGTTIVEGASNMVRLFDSANNESIWSYDTTSTVLSCAISYNGSTVAVGTDSGYVYIFGRDSNETIWTAMCSAQIYSLDVSNDGEKIALGDLSGRVYLFEKSSNQSIWEHYSGYAISSLSISNDGSTISIANTNYSIFTFGSSNNSTLWEYKASDLVGTVTVCRNGSTIVAATQEGLFVFQRNSNETVWSYSESFDRADISADGTTIAATRTNPNSETLFLWDISSNKTIWTYNGTERLWKISVSETGSQIVAGGYQNVSLVFSRLSNQSLVSHCCASYIVDVDISSNGQSFVTSCADGHTYYFSVVNPDILDVQTTKAYYNTSEVIPINVWVDVGSFNLSQCSIFFTHDNETWTSVVMENSSNLSDPIVEFNASIGAFDDDIYYYIRVFDEFIMNKTTEIFKVCIDDIGPDISVPIIHPIAPNSTDSVTTTVNVTDSESGVQKVVLNYRIIGSITWEQKNMTRSHGVTYQAIISPAQNGTIMEYYIQATDVVGNIAVEDNAGQYYNYLVIDLVPNATSDTNVTPDDGDPLFIVAIVITVGASIAIAGGVLYYIRHKKVESAGESSLAGNAEESSD